MHPRHVKRLQQNLVDVLLKGRHAAVGGKSLRERGQKLARIAAAYTRRELLGERGIGPRAADIIELWLASQGLALRGDEESVEHGQSANAYSAGTLGT